MLVPKRKKINVFLHKSNYDAFSNGNILIKMDAKHVSKFKLLSLIYPCLILALRKA